MPTDDTFATTYDHLRCSVANVSRYVARDFRKPTFQSLCDVSLTD